jgi:hypothetical protein
MDNNDKREELRHEIFGYLENYKQPLEESWMSQKVLTQQLEESIGQKSVRNPLSLVDIDLKVEDGNERQGSQKKYLDAVKSNLQARKEFIKTQQDSEDYMAALEPRKETETTILDLHLEVTSLQQRYDRLAIINKYLDRLEQQPAAALDFLDPTVMYKDCRPLPEVPREMVEGFAYDSNANTAEIEDLLERLQRRALRSKFSYRRDKQRFERARAERPVDLNAVPPQVKLEALGAVKNTLINWIETQLSHAGDDDDDNGADATDDTSRRTSKANASVDFESQLVGIQKEYQRHVQLRREVLGLLAQIHQNTHVKPDEDSKAIRATKEEDVSQESPDAQAYLITPYLERLQTLSNAQRGLIQVKLHINASLSKQQQETRTDIDQLARESELLRRYPSRHEADSEPRDEFDRTSHKSSAVLDRIQPWLHAADSAKIATLETVAEKVEEGMISIEESRKTLEDLYRTFNVVPGEEDKDLWLAEADEQSILRSPSRRKKEEAKQLKTVWSALDGNLGSINEL